MIRYLIERPIAVFMTFTALFIVGMVTYLTLPVSLLPDIAIPEITVQFDGNNRSARELENTVVKQVRLQLLQVGKLRNIRSETRNGSAVIRLNFAYGTNTDLAFIEVNEKIDQAMSQLARDVERPRVVKANTTDIPVFYVNVTAKNTISEDDELGFLSLSEFAENIIKRRIEQLPEVVMADITGVVYYQLQLRPDLRYIRAAGITTEDIESALLSNNVDPGSLTVQDGFYEYNIRFSSLLRTPEDVKNIFLQKNGRIYQMKDLAEVEIVARHQTGASLYNNKRAVTLAVIKQSEESMEKMKHSLSETLDFFRAEYPDIQFDVSRNQTELLDYTINNLKENMVIAFLFILIIALLFMGDMKSSLIIGGSMVMSIVICAILFYFFNRSLNIISLAGLITALGMMIDNSIIVTDNIARYREEGLSLDDACVKGTEEVITPILSSSLTTIAVFIPLVFMSGIAGAIFFDQAFSITAGLLVSYFTGIIFLPVFYKLLYNSKPGIKKYFRWMRKKPENARNGKKSLLTISNWLSDLLYRGYSAGIHYTFRHKKVNFFLFVCMFPLCVLLFYIIKKEQMPQIDQRELLVRIDWNENLHLDESIRRSREILESVDNSNVVEHAVFVGQQQFLLNRDVELTSSEAELYIKTDNPSSIVDLENDLRKIIGHKYPLTVCSFAPPATVFEKIFVTGEATLIAELYSKSREQKPEPDSIRFLEQRINRISDEQSAGTAFDSQINLILDRRKLLIYNVSYNEVISLLRTAFRENNVTTLRSYQQYLPVMLAGDDVTVNRLLNETLIETRADDKGKVYPVPLKELVVMGISEELKAITAGRNGEYIPLIYYEAKRPEKLMGTIRNEVAKQSLFDVSFTGSFFGNQQMISELMVILFVSLLLMYFILASQFESFLQPLIVLVEIPIDVAGALLVLWVFGHTLNLMSAIGIIVTCGIVINDSILKIDVINQLRKEGVPVMEAIHEAGKRRIRAIVMTSLTTIAGMVPFLFTNDMGSELQRPLAIAMIGAMFIGTIVSLFMIPLAYWSIYRKK